MITEYLKNISNVWSEKFIHKWKCIWGFLARDYIARTTSMAANNLANNRFESANYVNYIFMYSFACNPGVMIAIDTLCATRNYVLWIQNCPRRGAILYTCIIIRRTFGAVSVNYAVRLLPWLPWQQIRKLREQRDRAWDKSAVIIPKTQCAEKFAIIL